MRRTTLYTAVAALWLGIAPAGAQRPVITATVEPDSIMIGDRFTYAIEVERDLVQTVTFPEFGSDDRGALELVESLPVDTLARDGRRLRLRKRYVMAAFEEGRYALGRAKALYADKNIVDTLLADDSLFLKVATFQIDSTSQSIYDLKGQKTLPFEFREVSGYLRWTLVGVVLLAAMVWGLRRLLAHYGKGLGDIFRPAPPLPPHVAAIRALEALHNQKLWQNNRHKEYYSGLTDILRTYLAGRYGVGAMEMTTDEILEAMRDVEMPRKSALDMASVLRDGDLVKFAKAMPEAEQNEADYLKVYYFVEETKVQEEPATGDEEEIQNTKFNEGHDA